MLVKHDLNLSPTICNRKNKRRLIKSIHQLKNELLRERDRDDKRKMIAQIDRCATVVGGRIIEKGKLK